MNRSRTVLLAHGQPLLRAALRSVLAEHAFEVVAEADDADGAFHAASQHEPALSLVDGDLPGGALLAVRRIADGVPASQVVLILETVTGDATLAAVRAGANCVIARSTPVTGFVRALTAVHDGGVAIPRAALAALLHEFRGGRQRASFGDVAVSLTSRESQVLELLRLNLTTTEIAERLDLSQITVRRHLASVAAKAGTRNRSELRELVVRR